MRNALRSHIVGTRIHTNGASTLPDLSQFTHWCQSVLRYADQILVATDDHLFRAISQLSTSFMQVRVLQVSPWRGFSTPLNALVAEAVHLGGHTLLLQSFEVFVEQQSVDLMHTHLGRDTLVVGARLTPDHGGSPGVKPIDGLTTPWNTLALWNLDKLHNTGFLEVSSELPNGTAVGMEEVPTISLLQHQSPENAKAKIVTLPEVKWNVTWNDDQRSRYHHQKMITKRERAEIQLKYLQVPRGVVTVF